jgi:uncharacterized protein (TIGR02145 family)
MKLFKDGVLSGTFLPPPGLIDNCSGGTLNFGRYWDTRNFFNGKLDDIGIWNRALSQQEINSLYNSQLSQPCTTSVTTNLNVIGCGFVVLSNGDTVNQSGTYLDTLTTILGCDSILNQIVTIQPSSTCNPIPTYVPTNGLVGWWGFNGNAQDGSGNGNHGMVNGATLTTDRFGNQNKAYEFDGTDDYISVINSNSLSLSQYSISVWSKIDTSISWFPGRQLISKGCEWPIGVGVSYRIYFENTYYVMDNWAPSRSLLSNLINSFNSNWSHLVFTFDGQGNSMYLNGVLLGNATQNSALVSSLEPLFIGARKFASSCTISDNYSGKLDDIGIWNRALTQQEITNLYNSQLPTQSSLCLPTITTSSPTSVGVDSVVIGGDISNDGGSSIVLRGICYSTSPNPNMGNQRTEDGSGTGSFNTVLRGLISSTTYYARSYAKNSIGVVVYGNEVSFTTSVSLPGVRCPGTPMVTDIDGNIYNTVQIGGQCWTQSNLKVSMYRNGDSITTGLNNSAWQNTTSGAYAIYDNNPVNDGLYGKLYNHYAVTDSRGLCPTGWHVPTDGEWTTLVNNLGGVSVAGGALKSTAMQPTPGGWNSPNIGATNSSGFTALPGGVLRDYGVFNTITHNGYWWSTSVSSAYIALLHYLHSNAGSISQDLNYRTNGFSVRCLKNTSPQVNTTSVTNVTPSTALVTGEVISDGGDQNTTKGFCYSNTPNPTINNDTVSSGRGLGTYSATINGLSPFTTYYVRSFARNDLGISYGSEVSFRTSQLAVGDFYGGGYIVNIDTLTRTGLVCAPTDTGWHVWGCMGTNIIGTSSTLGSGQNNTNLILAGCSARPIAASVCADLVLNGYDDWFLPSSQELLLAYTRLRPMNIGNLGPMNYTSTQINSDLVNDVNTSGGFIGIIGQAFKWQNSGVRPFRYFTLPSLLQCGSSTVTDIDGNVYNTVLIGNQCWTQSNLKTSKYRNGDNIPTGLNNSDWFNTTSGAYAIYNNDPVNDGLYGKLYNHYAVTDSRGLCPTGWHIPSDAEWTTLEAHLGGQSVAGGALKSTATQPIPGGWNPPNTGATNSSGFTALPGGMLFNYGGFSSLEGDGYWWSSTVVSGSNALRPGLNYNASIVDRYDNDRTNGFSVRCLKNTLPQVNTTSVTSVTPSTALVTGEVISDGGDQNTTRGFCYSTTSNPTISNDTTMNGTGTGVYSGTLQNLNPLTTYYVRAYATNSEGTSYGNEVSFTTSSLVIGSNYAGGIVFYIDSTGQHGLVCAPTDQGTFQWGCYGDHIAGTSIALGAGLINTNLILNNCSQRPIAASICSNLVLHGYDDWFLPSWDELKLIHNNLSSNPSFNFVNYWYWSSTQAHNHLALVVNLQSGSFFDINKDNPSFVRAIRSF